MKNKKLITDLSRDFEKIYKDICKSHGLKIDLGCLSYIEDLKRKNAHYVHVYRNMTSKVLYLYIIRYIKSVRPSFYRRYSGHIMSYYTKKRFREGYDYMASYLPVYMLRNWGKLVIEANF